MTTPEHIIDEISKSIVSNFLDTDRLAKNSLHIMICGSHQDPSDKKVLTEIRDAIRSLGVPGCFLLEDIPDVEGMSYQEKFECVWDKMNKGDNEPLFILYAGKSSNSSTGFNSEIQTIALDKNKTSCAYLITHGSPSLTGFAGCIVNQHSVTSKEEAIELSRQIVQSVVKRVKLFYDFYTGGKR